MATERSYADRPRLSLSALISNHLKSGHNDSRVSSEIITPQSASAHLYRDLTDALALMGNVTWTGSSGRQDMTVRFPGTSEGNMVIRQRAKDAWSYALGINYKYDDRLLLRTGGAYQQAASDTGTAHPILVDGNRFWLSLGASYRLTPQSTVDLAYSSVFFRSVKLNSADDCSPASTTCTGHGETTRGVYKTHWQLIGVQYNYRF